MNKTSQFPFHPAALLAFLLVVLAASFLPAPVLAECCDRDSCGRCGDHTQGTPCCGYGKCNIFCCNCDGGCRHYALEGSAGRFAALDLDQSGGISSEEFEIWTGQAGRHFETNEDRRKAFEALDANENHVIDPREFDASLAGDKGKSQPNQ